MRIRRVILVTLGIAAAGAAVAVGFRDAWLRRITPRLTRAASGIDIEIETLSSTLVPLAIRLGGIRVLNPEAFGAEEGEAFRIDEFYVQVERRSLFGGELRLPEVRLHVPRIVAVVDARGRTNLDQIARTVADHRRAAEPAPAEPAPRPGVPDAPPPPGEPGPRPSPVPDVPPTPEAPAGRPYRIDRLVTRFGQLEIRDYSGGRARPTVRHVRLDREQVFHDVTDVADVAQQLAVQWAVAALPGLMDELEGALHGQDDLQRLRDETRTERRALRDALRASEDQDR